MSFNNQTESPGSVGLQQNTVWKGLLLRCNEASNWSVNVNTNKFTIYTEMHTDILIWSVEYITVILNLVILPTRRVASQLQYRNEESQTAGDHKGALVTHQNWPEFAELFIQKIIYLYTIKSFRSSKRKRMVLYRHTGLCTRFERICNIFYYLLHMRIFES